MSRNDPKHSARAKRTKGLRMMTGLSRGTFAKQTGIPPSSQQNWESLSANGLTEYGAQRVVQACALLGVHASFEWLMYGHGPSPVIDHSVFEDDISERSAAEPLTADEQTQFIQEELALFRKHYKEAIDLIVPDTSMEPKFVKGARVAGTRFYKDNIAQAINHDCIVLTQDGKQLLRHLLPSDRPNHYTLTSNQGKVETQLVSAAPVLWVRY